MSTKVYEILRDKIIEKLDEGTIPWKMTWNAKYGPPKNMASNKRYRGFNLFMLLCQGYTSPYWMTYNQITQAGGTVKEDQTKEYTIINYWKMLKNVDKKTGEETNRFPLIRYYRVYNLDQTENVRVPKRDEDIVTKYDNEPIENCEQIVSEMRDMPEIVWGKAPCYIPSQDRIGMPEMEHFIGAEQYYSVLFHEMAHSTKTIQRMNREKPSYAKEELIAEMSACFLCGTAGIETELIENTAAYIKGWRDKIIKNDVKLVVQAASEAQKVANWIMNISEFSEMKDNQKTSKAA